MCFDQPRIPKHRILKDHYAYNLSGRRRTSRWITLARGLTLAVATTGLLILAAEHSRASATSSCATLTPGSQHSRSS
ncbi:hypothetical protein G8770_15475 [Aestuariicella hydrocarbonica]|uniref:Uncharacterized protein n=1 Tax=Pseudomaricurvus hydrocarbonicus TaxID=1470433 RepID=A0A9E5MI75_9GAMM|nr:hypothetical protein [Aestuariicella hydrocarbonica]NHO66951.1 hypothetical protein [Aestuariicella hydrocarbonica]